MTFDIRIDSAHAEAIIGAAIKKVAQPAELMRTVAAELVSVTAFNFLAQGRPGWLGLQRPSPRRQGGEILKDRGHLQSSIQANSTETSAIAGSNLVYAAIHQLGGQTRPHVILPKNKKALAFNGRVVKKVNHPGSKILARPFLPIDANGNLQPEALSGIESAVQEYLQGVFDR